MCVGPVKDIIGGVTGVLGLAPDTPEPAVAPAQIAKTPDKQASKAPSQASQKAVNTATENAQGATPSTLLTGADGISADTLNLGKNTLLGR